MGRPSPLTPPGVGRTPLQRWEGCCMTSHPAPRPRGEGCRRAWRRERPHAQVWMPRRALAHPRFPAVRALRPLFGLVEAPGATWAALVPGRRARDAPLGAPERLAPGVVPPKLAELAAAPDPAGRAGVAVAAPALAALPAIPVLAALYAMTVSAVMMRRAGPCRRSSDREPHSPPRPAPRARANPCPLDVSPLDQIASRARIHAH